MPSSSAFLDALSGRHLGPPPAWIMRQAGRHLPSYQKLREKHSLLTLFTQSELIVQTTLLPIQTYPLDAAILFSDITLIARQFGRTIDFAPGPIIDRPLSLADPLLSPQEALPFLAPAITALRKELTVPLIGFAGAPATVARYLAPNPSPPLLQRLLQATLDLMEYQHQAGVQAFQIFESHPNGDPSLLAPLIQRARSLKLPLILFAKTLDYKPFAALQPTALSLTHGTSVAHARQAFPHLVLQGNLDPDHLVSPHLPLHLDALVTPMRGDPAYIFNLGHGIRPDTPPAAVHTLLTLLKTTS